MEKKLAAGAGNSGSVSVCQSFISDSGGQSCKAGEFYYAGNGKGALAYGSDGSFAAAVFSGGVSGAAFCYLLYD